MNNYDTDILCYTVPADKREQSLLKIRQTTIFLKFIEHRSYEDQLILFSEIEGMLDYGIPVVELLEVQHNCYEYVCPNDFRHIAISCFVEIISDVLTANKLRNKNLCKNQAYNEAFNTALYEIVRYLEKERDDFPRDAIRCLFLLTDVDVDPKCQGLAATRLAMESFEFCSDESEQAKIEELIKGCMID